MLTGTDQGRILDLMRKVELIVKWEGFKIGQEKAVNGLNMELKSDLVRMTPVSLT